MRAMRADDPGSWPSPSNVGLAGRCLPVCRRPCLLTTRFLRFGGCLGCCMRPHVKACATRGGASARTWGLLRAGSSARRLGLIRRLRGHCLRCGLRCLRWHFSQPQLGRSVILTRRGSSGATRCHTRGALASEWSGLGPARRAFLKEKVQ
jgi:hypothetical protein